MKTGSHILIVDDNADFRKLLKDVLETSGFTVSDASDGEEAIPFIEKGGIDLAICDLEMPRMNGLDFARWVKDHHPHIPVIMVTAYAQFHAPSEILASGIDIFLQKPIQIATLLDEIEKL